MAEKIKPFDMKKALRRAEWRARLPEEIVACGVLLPALAGCVAVVLGLVAICFLLAAGFKPNVIPSLAHIFSVPFTLVFVACFLCFCRRPTNKSVIEALDNSLQRQDQKMLRSLRKAEAEAKFLVDQAEEAMNAVRELPIVKSDILGEAETSVVMRVGEARAKVAELGRTLHDYEGRLKARRRARIAEARLAYAARHAQTELPEAPDFTDIAPSGDSNATEGERARTFVRVTGDADVSAEAVVSLEDADARADAAVLAVSLRR